MRDLLIRTILGVWIGVLLVWLVSSFNTKRSVQREGLTSGVVHRLPVIAAYVLLFLNNIRLGPLDTRIVPATDVWALVGALLVVAGFAFSLAARFVIGRNWSAAVTVKQDHELMQSGPFGVVRHPIYSGFLLATLGTACAFGELRDFLAFLLAFIGWKIKSLGEEGFMHLQFGEQYAEYTRRVKGLIPFVW